MCCLGVPGSLVPAPKSLCCLGQGPSPLEADTPVLWLSKATGRTLNFLCFLVWGAGGFHKLWNFQHPHVCVPCITSHTPFTMYALACIICHIKILMKSVWSFGGPYICPMSDPKRIQQRLGDGGQIPESMVSTYRLMGLSNCS